jgi:hypothetical protein
VSDHDEPDPQETHDGGPDPSSGTTGAFEAFRARRAAERTANEAFPAEYLVDPVETSPGPAQEAAASPEGPGGYEASADFETATSFEAAASPYPSGQYEAPGRYDEPLQYPPLPPYAGAAAAAGPGGRGRVRSVGALALAAVIVAGVAFGIYAAVGGSPSTGSAAAAAPATSVTPNPVDTMRGKPGRTVTAKVTILSMGADSFRARTADGETVTVAFGARTRFGIAGRPFTRAQLAPGTTLYVRGVRVGADGIAATILAGSDPAAAAAGSGSAA